MKQRMTGLIGLLSCLLLVNGCGTTRVTDTQRTATEQLLISSAVDETIVQLDFSALAGKTVYFDPQYLESASDKGYVISSLRQHLLAHGALLQEERTRATYVVEARSGGLGTDRHDLLVGVPQMTLPTIVPGQPSQIPEIPFAKRIDQRGVAKLAVFAYNRQTGRPVWQSGTVENYSSARNVWLCGAGPFHLGSIKKSTEFAGDPLRLPFLGESEQPDMIVVQPGVSVVRPAVWNEPAGNNNEPVVRLLGALGVEEKKN